MAENAEILCPLMRGPCIKDGAVVDGKLVACRFWVTVHGKNPQTGEVISTGDCAFCWTPMLMIENTKVNRETGAAIDDFKNESVTNTQLIAKALVQASSAAQIPLTSRDVISSVIER